MAVSKSDVIRAKFWLEIIEEYILRDLSAAGQPGTIAAIIQSANDQYGPEAGALVRYHLMSQFHPWA